MSSQKLFSLLFSLAMIQMAFAGDPDAVTDFLHPPLAQINASFFTFTGWRALVSAPLPKTFTFTKASTDEFPALNGQSVSYAVHQFPAGTTNPPHIHPRSGELLFVLEGYLTVGFLDSTNKLYVQALQKGDLFLFPKGLVHFQYNTGQTNAIAISAFGGANPGIQSLPETLFTAGIDENILAKSFNTDIATIQHLKAGIASKH